LRNFVLAKLFGNTERSIANWRQEDRLVIKLIEKNFDEKQILDFLETGDIPDIKQPYDYSLVKRALKTRIKEFRDEIVFFDTALIKYLRMYHAAIISSIDKKNEKIDTKMKRNLIVGAINTTDIQFSYDDLANLRVFRKMVDKKLMMFYANLSDVEIDFIFDHPQEFAEIIKDSFTKLESFMLKMS
jgi:hypothetical protein